MIGPNLSFSKKIVVNAYCFYVLVILLPITVFPFRTRKTVPSRSFLRDTYKNIDNKLFLLTPHSKNAIQMFSFAEGQAQQQQQQQKQKQKQEQTITLPLSELFIKYWTELEASVF